MTNVASSSVRFLLWCSLLSLLPTVFVSTLAVAFQRHSSSSRRKHPLSHHRHSHNNNHHHDVAKGAKSPFSVSVLLSHRHRCHGDTLQYVSLCSSSLQQEEIQEDGRGGGLYRPLTEQLWDKLLQAPSGCDGLETVEVDEHLRHNAAPAKGFPATAPPHEVRIETRAVSSSPNNHSPISYARFALLETCPVVSNDSSGSDSNCKSTSTVGIQVLNMIIIPDSRTNLPVWGADLVSLPGNKHLLLLDAQPMTKDKGTDEELLSNNSVRSQQEAYWKEWYEKFVDGDATADTTSSSEEPPLPKPSSLFPWGGDLPEKVQPFVSKYALWSRLGMTAAAPPQGQDVVPEDPIAIIQGPLVQAALDHLDIYLHLLHDSCNSFSKSRNDGDNNQEAYLRYRLENDPARPMLRSLYGEEWTEKLLTQVLFPQ